MNNSPYAGDFIMVEQGKFTASICASQVQVYVHSDRNHVHLWNRTHSEDCVLLGVVDALASNKTWPDYLLYNGRVYRRDLQEAHPSGASASDWFGFRLYVKTRNIDTGRTHTLMILSSNTNSAAERAQDRDVYVTPVQQTPRSASDVRKAKLQQRYNLFKDEKVASN